MFKRILLLAVATIVGVLGVGFGAAAEPGPNGHNDHGLCTAYFNGQKNGHGEGEDQDKQPPPFQGLEDTSRDYTDNDGTDNDNDGETDEEGENESLTDAENIFNYCHDNSVIGGNPTHGRFTCSDEGGIGTGPDSETDPECNKNPGPGKS